MSYESLSYMFGWIVLEPPLDEAQASQVQIWLRLSPDKLLHAFLKYILANVYPGLIYLIVWTSFYSAGPEPNFAFLLDFSILFSVISEINLKGIIS